MFRLFAFLAVLAALLVRTDTPELAPFDPDELDAIFERLEGGDEDEGEDTPQPEEKP